MTRIFANLSDWSVVLDQSDRTILRCRGDLNEALHRSGSLLPLSELRITVTQSESAATMSLDGVVLIGVGEAPFVLLQNQILADRRVPVSIMLDLGNLPAQGGNPVLDAALAPVTVSEWKMDFEASAARLQTLES
ncbi:MAG TPA: hypothetical protein VFV47_13730 [Hyphomicrobiaceae bacterium]|nr:hypothetical protein [Hyphomicrobiaceae bacterium]